MSIRLLAVLLTAWVQVAVAQTAVRPALMDSREAEQPIRLQRLQLSGDIVGGLAQTTVRMVFFNPNARQLEGQLQFPLLEGQQVTGFALDIDGRMRPAVPVEKAKGRQVFEAVERRQIDPALLENTQGQHFRLRVYPIPPGGTRTVELHYTEALAREGAQWSYRLPLAYGDRLQDFDLQLKVAGAAGAPQAGGALGSVHFDRVAEGYAAHVAKSRFAPAGALTIRVPAPSQPQTHVGVRDGLTYFVAELPVATQRTPRRLPTRVGLLWDSSGSGAGRAHDAELDELDRYFKALGQAEVRLTRLRDRASPPETFRVVDGRWGALRAALAGTRYDGASALADWTPEAGVGEYLLVSDGLINYGGARFPQLAPGQRLYAISSGIVADTTRLAALAERSGGRWVQVRADRPGAAAQELLTDVPRVERIDAVGATQVLADSSDLRQGIVRIAGKLTRPAARITLNLVQQGRGSELTLSVSANAAAHPLVPQVWAGVQLHALEAEFEANRAAIRRLGTEFSIASRETSLIVLDRLEDYVQHDIAPPAEYLAAFEQMRRTRGVELTRQRRQHLDRVVREFEQKLAWWDKRYPKDEPPVAKREAGRNAPTPAGALAPRAALMAAAPAAAPAPMAESAARERRADAALQPGAGPQIGIALQKWRPDAPYLARMVAADAASAYAVYLDEKPSYANSTAFFLDVADVLFDKGQRELALRVLSNLAEMDLENRHVLRILGYRLMQAGAPELAVPVFEKVLRLAEEEPQSFRDLGLAHAAAGHAQQAVDHLWEVVERPWDDRFAEVELIALAELNAIVATAPAALDTRRIDPRLARNLPLDLRVVLTWDADNSDMDLWVTDPNGEKCFYSHRFTYQGGRMSRDFTGGYGPEEFSLRTAKPGKYKVEASFFGSRQQVVAGATTVQVALTTGFGTAAAKEQQVTLRLKGRGDTVFVGEFEVGAP